MRPTQWLSASTSWRPAEAWRSCKPAGTQWTHPSPPASRSPWFTHKREIWVAADSCCSAPRMATSTSSTIVRRPQPRRRPTCISMHRAMLSKTRAWLVTKPSACPAQLRVWRTRNKNLASSHCSRLSLLQSSWPVRVLPWLGRMPEISEMTSICPASQNRAASFSAMGITTNRAKSFVSRNWPKRSSATPPIRTSLITAEDLAHYEVKERKPIRGTYRRYEIISAPPPSSGGIALLEILNILEGYDLAKLGNRSAQSVHLTLEAFRRAFFDRAEFLGDPDFSKIPVAQLIDKRYAAAWRESINPAHASASKDLKRPAIFSELEQYADAHPAELGGHEPPHTTHYSVVDAEGSAVAVTTTINDWFGSRVTAEGLGFLLNDEMDDFSAKLGVPNADGLIQGAANAIGPGKRPLSSMTPTIVVHQGKTVLVLGSPGSSKIITTVANVLMGVIDYGMNLQESVNAPRFHNQWMPDVLNVEKWFSPDTVNALRHMGYKVEIGLHDGSDVSPYWSDAECIAIDPKTSERLGAR